MIDITLTTATGDRPEVFALCERWMRRQTFWPQVRRWVVIDDGKIAPTRMALGQDYIRREPRPDDPRFTETLNYLTMAREMARTPREGAMFFIEDDDYYGPSFLEKMAELLECADLVGEVPSKYYNVANRTYMTCGHQKHGSLCQTAIRGSVVPTWIEVLENVRPTENPFSDIVLWKTWKGSRAFLESPQKPFCVGIKGMPGRGGIGCGHRSGPDSCPADLDLSVLRRWIGDDADTYAPFFQGELPPPAPTEPERPLRVALLCPGPSLAAFPGREGYDFVIGVNRAARQTPCDYWVFLDTHVPMEYGPPLGRPTLVSRASVLRRLARGGDRAAWSRDLPTLPLERVPAPRLWPAKWDTLSATTGLATAVHLGATRIDCFGVDWSGRQDWDGFEDFRQDRTEKRWDRERTVWFALVAGLADRGIVVVRSEIEGARHAG